MQIKLQLVRGEGDAAHDVATIVLDDRPQKPPAWRATGVLFALVEITCDDTEMEAAIRAALERDSIGVSVAQTAVSGGVRMRGTYTRPEPYGTPAYWRAAVGLLPRTAGVEVVQANYSAMLREMERLAAQAAAGRARLRAALEALADAAPARGEGLRAWAARLGEETAVAAEIVTRAVLASSGAGSVTPKPALSRAGLETKYLDTRSRRGSLRTRSVTSGDTLSVKTGAMINGATVKVGSDSVQVTFLEWTAPELPLLVLVPEAAGEAPRTADPRRITEQEWEATFTDVPAGAYLLALAPVET